MRLGKLTKRITIRRATDAGRNAMNEPVPVWTNAGTIWAEQVNRVGVERHQAAQTAAMFDCVFRARWSPIAATVTSRDRLICDGRTYEITGVVEVGRQAGIEITATGYLEEGSENAG